MKQAKQIKLAYPGVIIILALLTLISIFVVPIFNGTGAPYHLVSIIPSEHSYSFSDVYAQLFEYGFQSYAVQLTFIPLIFAVITVVCSCIKKQLPCILSSLGGFLVMVGLLVNLVLKHGTIVLGNILNHTVLCLGFWLVLFLFLATFIVSLIPRSNHAHY